MPEQLSFDLPLLQALGRDDFFVSPANAQAVAMIEGWQDWPGRKLILTGAAGAGKTHLAHVWADLSRARIIPATDLAGSDIAQLATGPVAIEDAHQISGDRAAEDALFHLHNLLLAEGHSVLLTALTAPSYWGLQLPDLASRMQGTTLVTLQQPDDALLSAVMMKLLSDRQLSPSPGTIPYLARRIDRSFESARKTIDALDNEALQNGAPITRSLAARVLDNMPE